jgi:tripartite-type tricarboxylate transporter receptor subunit TctC
MTVRRSFGILLALCFLLAGIAADAAGVEDFYKGNTIRVLIGYDPGTGYDVFARALARHLGDHIPGKPQILPQNMPGAASLTMMNYLYNVAPRDGTAIGLPARNLFAEPLFGNKLARYDPLKFTFIGNMSRDVAICVTWKASGMSTFQDALDHEILVGATAPNSISTIYPQVLNAILKTRFKIITGYTDGSAIGLAMARNEIQGYCGYTISSILSSHPDWIKNNLVDVILQLTLVKSPELPDVPSVMDVVKDDESRQALALEFGDLAMGRPVVGPPDVPDQRTDALRRAFDETMKDPAFLQDAKQSSIDIDPMTGEDLEKVLRQILAAPKSVVDKVAAIRGQNPN